MAKNRITFTDDFVLRNEKVGIGTTNPTDTLNTFGTVRFGGTTQNPNFYVANSGYVGFGTTNPTSNVEFKESVRFSAIGATSTENINLSPYTEQSGALSFESGNYQTQHFSVTNVESNVVFAINDTNADPYLQVTDAGITSIRNGEFRSLKGVAVGATASEIVTMLPYTEESGSLSFENISGEYQHLSLTNETGGDIFAVNDDNAEAVLAVSNSGVVHSGITTIGLTTTATAPSVNATMSFELISNTELTIRVKGTDGTTRTGIVTLS